MLNKKNDSGFITMIVVLISIVVVVVVMAFLRVKSHQP